MTGIITHVHVHGLVAKWVRHIFGVKLQEIEFANGFWARGTYEEHANWHNSHRPVICLHMRTIVLKPTRF